MSQGKLLHRPFIAEMEVEFGLPGTSLLKTIESRWVASASTAADRHSVVITALGKASFGRVAGRLYMGQRRGRERASHVSKE